jgi:hypothetical protein
VDRSRSEQSKAAALELEYRELQQEIKGLRAQLQPNEDSEEVEWQYVVFKWREMAARYGCMKAIGTHWYWLGLCAATSGGSSIPSSSSVH